MVDSLIELKDIEEEGAFGPRLFVFNVTNNLELALPNRFNKTLVAFLSGAILFLLINTAFLLAYITPKAFNRKEKENSYKNGQNENDKSENHDDFVYDEYYDYYYYEDIPTHNNYSSSEATPRYVSNWNLINSFHIALQYSEKTQSYGIHNYLCLHFFPKSDVVLSKW